ncbi:Ribosome-Releasing Factor 2 [Manis pentadactyla]|nr:Ribosome-Releasing Factor 2 [Manis pentadactyla]
MYFENRQSGCALAAVCTADEQAFAVVSCAGNIAAGSLRCSLTRTRDHLPGTRGCRVRPGSTSAHSQVERQSAQAAKQGV